MKINVLTLFPEMFSAVTGSILGRARDKGILEFNFVNIRDFSHDKHKKADDYTYGGGPGLVMLAEPIFEALLHIGAEPAAKARAICSETDPCGETGSCSKKDPCGETGSCSETDPCSGRTQWKEQSSPDSLNAGESSRRRQRLLYMSPRGRVLNQRLIEELSEEEELTILCGHYEGVDQRVLDYFGMEEVSIGDYVLTGGELPAMVLIDSVARLIPGVLSGEASATEESVYSGLLEHPQYTKPRSFHGMEVPEVLLSGNHRLIHLWRFEKALRLTREVRPDLFEVFVKNHRDLSKDEQKVLEKVIK